MPIVSYQSIILSEIILVNEISSKLDLLLDYLYKYFCSYLWIYYILLLMTCNFMNVVVLINDTKSI